MARDYYDVLGVSRDAGPDELQQAFRRLARQNHPDVNRDPGAEERFKEINEAYSVLSDPKQRKKYDRFGEDFRQIPDDWEERIGAGAGGGRGGAAAGGGGPRGPPRGSRPRSPDHVDDGWRRRCGLRRLRRRGLRGWFRWRRRHRGPARRHVRRSRQGPERSGGRGGATAGASHTL